MSLPAPVLLHQFRFVEESHTYWFGDRRIPGVTEALCPIHDLADVPAHVLEHARQVGQAIHAAIKLHNADDLVVESLDLEIVLRFEAWLAFVKDTGFRVRGFEQPMGSNIYQYGGTPDLWGEMGGHPWLPDIKATAVIAPSVAVQTAAYRQLLTENSAPSAKPRRAALHLRKDGTYRFIPYEARADSEDMQTFQSLLRIAHWRMKHLEDINVSTT